MILRVEAFIFILDTIETRLQLLNLLANFGHHHQRATTVVTWRQRSGLDGAAANPPQQWILSLGLAGFHGSPYAVMA